MPNVTFPQYPAVVTRTVTLHGVQVDIVQHMAVRQERIDSEPQVTVAYYQALRAGQYTLTPATVTFRGHTWSSARWTAATPAAVLARSNTPAGAVSAARSALAEQAMLDTYGPDAVANVRTFTEADFDQLPRDGQIEPGDIVVGWGHNRWRQGVVIKVTNTRIHYLFSTPSSQGRLTGGSGLRSVVRLVRKAASRPESAAEMVVGPIRVNLASLNRSPKRIGRAGDVTADDLPAGFVPMDTTGSAGLPIGKTVDGKLISVDPDVEPLPVSLPRDPNRSGKSNLFLQ